MYKIILINPPSPYLANDAAYPPTGLLYLSSVLEKEHHDVSIIDLTGNPDCAQSFPHWMQTSSE